MALTEVFRTASAIEAAVVQGLLESRGIPAVRTAGPPGVFAFAVSPFGATRVSVRDQDATEALRLIETHLQSVGAGMIVTMPQQFAALESRLGYRFRDRGLLEHALTHRSKAHEDPSGGVVDNESLEFLGDAVLGMVIAEALFRRYPGSSEGQKSKIKARVVSTASLAALAERLALGEHMILGRGEEKTGGRRKSALLADTCEALIAAIYLDGGFDPARDFLLRMLGDALDSSAVLTGDARDDKSTLQEQLQALGRPLPVYRVLAAEGPDHRKLFRIELLVGSEVLATGEGRTKKEAQQEAARAALATLSQSQ